MADKIDISAVARVVDQASGPLKRITQGITGAGKAATGTSGAFFRLNAFKFGGITAGVRGVSSSIGGLVSQVGRMIGPLVALGGVATLGGAVTGMKNFIETTDQLAKRARQLGTTVETLQQFRFVAERSGVSIGTLESGLSRFQRTLGTVAQGGKAAAKIAPLLTKMGISMQEIRAGDLAAILPKIAKGFEANVNPIQRNAALFALFGKSGQQLYNVFAQGQGAMRDLMAEAVRLGIITNDQAREAEAARDAWTDLERSITGVKNTIFAALLPSIKPTVDALKEMIVANREVIATEVTNFLTELGRILRSIDWAAVAAGARAVGRALDWMAQAIGGWEYVILAFIALLNRNLIAALANVGIAFGKFAVTLLVHGAQMLGLTKIFAAVGAAIKAFGLALLASPVTWFIGIIVALAAAAYLIYKNWEPISQFFSDLWNEPQATFQRVLAWLGDFALQFIPQPVLDAWSAVASWFSGVWEGVRGAFWGTLGWLGDFAGQFIPEPVKAAWADLGAWAAAVWNVPRLAFEGALGWLDNFAAQFIPAPIRAAWDAFGGWFAGIWGDVEADFGRQLAWLAEFAGNFVSDPIRHAWQGLSGWFSMLWEDPKTAFWDAIAWLGEFAVNFIPEPVRKAWAPLADTFAAMWQRIRGLFQGAYDFIAGIVDRIAAAVEPLLGIARRVGGAVSGIASTVGGWFGIGGGQQPAAAPAAAAAAPGQQRLLPAAARAGVAGEPTARLEGEIDQRIKIEASPELKASLTQDRTRGPIRSNVEVGRTMEPAYS